MLSRYIPIILLGLCVSETKFYYPENNITKTSLNSNALVDIDNNFQSFEYFKDEKIDKFENTHLIFQQSYSNIPVFGSYLRAHFNLQGKLSSLSSNIYPNLKININPTLSDSKAKEIIRAYINGDNMSLSNPQLYILIKNDIPILCYKIEIIGFEDAWRYFINASSGKVDAIVWYVSAARFIA